MNDQCEQLRTQRPIHRADLEASRLVVRGEVSYVVHDPLTLQNYRLSCTDYRLLAALNGRRTLGDAFEQLVAQGLVAEADEEKFYRFVLRLESLAVIDLGRASGRQLYQRHMRREERRRKSRWRKLFFFRLPLAHPDACLSRTLPGVRFLFTRPGVTAWTVLMAISLYVLVRRWSDFAHPLSDVLATGNLFYLWLSFLALKVIHELGHGYACKFYGGQVPEMGAYFMVFNPYAYVDASTAWRFPSTRQRLVVSFGGMYFESIVAAIAVLVWSFTGPSLIHSCAHNLVVTASVVTVLFNLNPLIKFDGYYIVCDVLGVPNLRARASRQTRGLLKMCLLAFDVPSSGSSFWRSAGLVAYGVASSLYMTSLVIGISVAVASRFPVVGLGLAGFYIITRWGESLMKILRYLWRADETAPVRVRAIVLSAALLAMPCALFLIPVPIGVRLDGYVSREVEHHVRLRTAGFVRSVGVEAGQNVEPNQTLAHLDSVDVGSALAKNAADVIRTLAHFKTQSVVNRVQASQTRHHIGFLHERLAASRIDFASLNAAPQIGGHLVRCVSHRDEGLFVPPGRSVALVVAGPWTIRALASADAIADSRPEIGQRVFCRLRACAGNPLAGVVTRVDPAGLEFIDNLALTQNGGGGIAVDPATNEAAEAYFEIIIRLDDQNAPPMRHGMKAKVLLDRQRESLGRFAIRRVLTFLNELRSS